MDDGSLIFNANNVETIQSRRRPSDEAVDGQTYGFIEYAVLGGKKSRSVGRR